MTQKSTKHKKKADQYNDPSHNYLHYWEGREYEDASERLAIKKLLRGRHFRHAADIGGGYGRLCVFLEKYADKVTLAEPSQQQLDIAKDFLKDHPEIDRKLTQADDLNFKDKELDLITMVRVMHHLPDPSTEFKEISRALADDGTFILEIASFGHFKNRLKYFVRGKRMPIDPVDIRSEKNKREEEIAFVNHNPKTVIKQLAHAGLRVEKVLSVSNLRSTSVKKVVPRNVMLAVEKVMQAPLGKTFFGPSVWMLVKKAK
jgi:ubiquinone/menaquinone biosynthesis C-methylase UbiE